MRAVDGRPVNMNFTTIPEWMFKTGGEVGYPAQPDEIDWKYKKGIELRDSSLRELRDYFARVVSWYTKGGFTDEYGLWHESGHHFKFDVWEVLNEPDFAHHLSPQLYVRAYDAIVEALRKLDPQMRFAGPALGAPGIHAEFFEYFLDPKNHQPGIPVDFLTYHFYATPEHDETPATEEHTFFELIDGFVSDVRYIELIRKCLSPGTKSYIDELGTTTSKNFTMGEAIPESYWSLSAATFATPTSGWRSCRSM